MKTLMMLVVVVVALLSGCSYGGDMIVYYLDGGISDAGVVLDGGGEDTGSDEDTDSETDTEGDAGSDSGDLGCMEGNYTILNTVDVQMLAPYTCITGNLTVHSSGLTSLSLPNLERLDGHLHINTNADLLTVELNALITLGVGTTGALQIYGNPELISVHFDSLLEMPGTSVYVNPSLVDVSFSALTTCSSINISSNESLAVLANIGLSVGLTLTDVLHVSLNPSLADCAVCDLLSRLTATPVTIDVQDNLDDSCSPVPANCP